MLREFVAMALLAVPCAIFGVMVAFALGKWAAGYTVAIRTLLASTASVCPILGIVAYAAGGSIEVIFSMSPDEFIIPFAMQIALTIALAVPAVWLVSRRRPNPHSHSHTFK